MEIPVPLKIPSVPVQGFMDAANAEGMRNSMRFGFPSAGVNASNANASTTLTVETSYETEIWAVPLTADRTVTLSTTNAAAGAEFLIVRSASSTGAFNLSIGTGPLKVLSSASTWARFKFGNGQWYLIASGTL